MFTNLIVTIIKQRIIFFSFNNSYQYNLCNVIKIRQITIFIYEILNKKMCFINLYIKIIY